MIAIDTNILVYAHRQEMPLHRRAREALFRLAEGKDPWALPVFCIAEFLRVVTHPRLFDPPSSLQEALEALEALTASPSLLILFPGDRYVRILAETAREADARGNLLYDVQIAAVCREHGVQDLMSQDRDFTRFSWIKLHTL